jgi:hypothetical protein
VEGTVLFEGRPAPGKIVSLLVAKGNAFADQATASADSSGVYRFTGLAAGAYKVTYVSVSVPDGNNVKREPNEIGIWRTRARDVSSTSGARMPAFDVAYNGLIYPSSGLQYIVSNTLPLPFHWSTHMQAQKYRLLIFNNCCGKEPAWWPAQTDWYSQPTALFSKDLNPGTYSWQVVIDAGDAGEGRSLVRRVDMGPPNAPPASPPGEVPALP